MKQAWDEDTQEAVGTQEARGSSFSRGFLIAVPLALALWAAIAWLI